MGLIKRTKTRFCFFWIWQYNYAFICVWCSINEMHHYPVNTWWLQRNQRGCGNGILPFFSRKPSAATKMQVSLISFMISNLAALLLMRNVLIFRLQPLPVSLSISRHLSIPKYDTRCHGNKTAACAQTWAREVYVRSPTCWRHTLYVSTALLCSRDPLTVTIERLKNELWINN